MKFFIHIEGNTITSVIDGGYTEPPEGYSIIETELTPAQLLTEVGVLDNKLVDIGPRPNDYSRIAEKNGTLVWESDISLKRMVVGAELNRQRIVQNYLPITIDGVRLDADEVAQNNLSNKLLEVKERIRLNITMPKELMVWKTADNTILTFDNIDQYHDWLAAYAIAIAERGTRLYSEMWAAKSTLA